MSPTTRDRDGRSRQQDPAETSDAGDSDANVPRKSQRREATVFDAVAGRVTSTNALDHGSTPASLLSHQHRRSRRGTHKLSRQKKPGYSRNAILAPEEVLFRRANAPVRFSERDIYFAHDRLPESGSKTLPDSDMLKALHVYASHFYAHSQSATSNHGTQKSGLADASIEDGSHQSRHNKPASIDERSMDETAMLAFGIILEEASRELLGSSGDLVFTEGIEPADAVN